MNVKKKSGKFFLSTKKWRQSGRDNNFRGNYKFRAHCISVHTRIFIGTYIYTYINIYTYIYIYSTVNIYIYV